LKASLSLFPVKGVKLINLFELYSQYDLKKFFTFISSGNEDLEIKPGEIDFLHPNQLGNAYIAKIILKEAFSVNFDPETYIKDTLAGEMFPKY
jgi:hypothetical protein